MEERKDEVCDGFEVHEDLLKIVNETLPEETELYDLAELFKVFGDSTRIRILFVLFEAEVCVCDLLIFHENLSIQNIIGILVVLFGVWTVQRYE